MPKVDQEFEFRYQERNWQREQRRKMRRIRNIFLVFVLLAGIVFSGRAVVDHINTNSAAAGSRIPVSPSTGLNEKEKTEEKDPENRVFINDIPQEWVGKLSPRTEKVQAGHFQDKLDCFLLTNGDTALYERNSVKANRLELIPRGTYVETYGHEDGWTLASYQGAKGYIRDSRLDVIEDPTLLKVVDGQLIVNKLFRLPQNFETVFNEQAASALRVMMEAMEREGLSIQLASTYRSADEQAKENDLLGNAANIPAPGHSALQTGYGVQFYLKGTDPRLDNHFEETDQYQWLAKHAAEYGYILRYPRGSEPITGYRADPTIFYYVGNEDAAKISQQGLTMEVYYGVEDPTQSK